MKVTILDSEHNIKLYDWSDVITEDHNRQIVEETNRLLSLGHYIQEDHPRYHISGDPFEDQPAEIWQVMKNTFHESCRDYIGKPYTILSTQSRVTRMVYDKEIDYTEEQEQLKIFLTSSPRDIKPDEVTVHYEDYYDLIIV